MMVSEEYEHGTHSDTFILMSGKMLSVFVLFNLREDVDFDNRRNTEEAVSNSTTMLAFHCTVER